MKNLLPFLVLLAVPCALPAQYLTGIATYYSDSFVEWSIFTEEDDGEGTLEMRWKQQNDWSEWDYRLGESFGTIKMKWRGQPDEWELRGANQIVTARTLWSGDLREWRVSDGSLTLTFKTKWGNQWDEWELRDTRSGSFKIFTRWERDPREWEILDELDAEVSFEVKMMLAFLAVFHSSPKQ